MISTVIELPEALCNAIAVYLDGRTISSDEFTIAALTAYLAAEAAKCST